MIMGMMSLHNSLILFPLILCPSYQLTGGIDGLRAGVLRPWHMSQMWTLEPCNPAPWV